MQIISTVHSTSISTNTPAQRQARQIGTSAHAASSAQATSHSPMAITDPAANADNAMALNSATPSTLPSMPACKAMASWWAGTRWWRIAGPVQAEGRRLHFAQRHIHEMCSLHPKRVVEHPWWNTLGRLQVLPVRSAVLVKALASTCL